MTAKQLTHKDISSLTGEFRWCFKYGYFITTEKGNFIWKAPEFGGDNILIPYDSSFSNFKKEYGLSTFRWEGVLSLGHRCGNFILK